MLKKLIAIALLLIVMIGCNNKAPFVPDYEYGVGSIICRETCRVNTSENAWLIQFSEPNPGLKSYGETITYNGSTYPNVVKTYLLPDTLKVPGKKYFFEFYLEGKSAVNDCEVPSPITFDIPKIRPKNIGRLAN